MNRVVKSVFWAFWPILFLVIVPQIGLSRISQTTQNQITQYTNISVSSFVIGLNIFGIVLAVLSGLQSWAYKWSIVKLVSSSLHMIVSFLLMLYIIGIGNISTLGVTDLNIVNAGSSANVNLTLSLTLTFLTLMVGIAVVLKILQKTMKYLADVRIHRMGIAGTVGPGPFPASSPTVSRAVDPLKDP